MKVHCAYTEMFDVDLLVKHPHNPNIHPKQQIEYLAKILKYAGWRAPIVVSKRSGFIIKGHARLEAALLNGWKQVPIDRQEYESEAAEYQDLIADNKISEMAHLDDAEIKTLVDDLKQQEPDFDLSLLGYMENEINAIVQGWSADYASIEAINPTDEPAPGKIKITCKSEDEDEIKTALKKWFSTRAFADIEVE